MQISYEENVGRNKNREQLVRFRTAALNGPLGEISGTGDGQQRYGGYIDLCNAGTGQYGSGPGQVPFSHRQFKFEGLPDLIQVIW